MFVDFKRAVRRNDELALLYEKIKLQQATMNKGELQYRQRMEDLRVLKLEIRKLQREKTILHKSVSSVEELRKEIFHTQVWTPFFKFKPVFGVVEVKILF